MIKYITLAAFLNFVLYAFTSIGLLGVFGKLYTWLTPYHEFEEIKRGCVAPALAFGGAILGFVFPLLSVSYNSIAFFDFILWAIIAGLLQLGLFKLLYAFIPMDVEADNIAIAVVYASLALSIGLITAFSLIPA